jgi:hypothetical protein
LIVEGGKAESKDAVLGDGGEVGRGTRLKREGNGVQESDNRKGFSALNDTTTIRMNKNGSDHRQSEE